MVSQKDLYRHLRDMVEWTRGMQWKVPQETREQSYGAKAWAKEFCTIKDFPHEWKNKK